MTTPRHCRSWAEARGVGADAIEQMLARFCDAAGAPGGILERSDITVDALTALVEESRREATAALDAALMKMRADPELRGVK
jgi:TRAP-type C4-dicarboxylate transport system permease small subunit